MQLHVSLGVESQTMVQATPYCILEYFDDLFRLVGCAAHKNECVSVLKQFACSIQLSTYSFVHSFTYTH